MSSAPTPPPSFEQCLKRLEAIVTELERADLPLEDSIRLFEEGMALSHDCRRQLDEAEAKIEILMKRNGGLQAEPFELKDE
ncbi:MAG TPA: exodeoxyribonuclease VII small subunit [Terriglobales bacterium]|nr:exodeoxyribonuclease VII small subunit [Terriglobales bacterium]